jgi:hypothetical protein
MTRDAWWIELLENELPTDIRQDVAKIFARSPTDMAALADLSRLRHAIKESDPSQALWDEEKAEGMMTRLQVALSNQASAAMAATIFRKQRTLTLSRDSSSEKDFSGKTTRF